MKEQFIERAFSNASLSAIAQANSIIVEYRKQGFTLTLRQLYYQFVARDLLPNTMKSYKRLGSIVNDGRLAGLIDWSAIEDRTRNVRRIPAWDSPSQIIEASADQYQEDLWGTQEHRVEVWIEKDALIGVIENVCEELRLPHFACRGYTSQSEQYSAGKRFAKALSDGQKPIVLHLGDHDPSGIDMTRDNADRLFMFARSGVDVRRLALNMDQVEQYDPPPNPAKESDSRSPDYRARFGDSSWELDALDPPVIERLIRDAVADYVDTDAWEAAQSQEQEERERLQKIASRWSDVVSYIEESE